MSFVLFTRPNVSGAGNRGLKICAGVDVDPLGDDQDFLRIALQGSMSKASTGTVPQKSFAGFDKRSRPMTGDDRWISKKCFERRQTSFGSEEAHSLSGTAYVASTGTRPLAVAGFCSRTPHKSGGHITHTALPLDASVEAHIRIGMQGARCRNPPVENGADLPPGYPRLLAPASQYISP